LAVEPKLLCLDEPFSALDFLTAENLRTELIDLWTDKRMPIKSVIMITHNIEEAVLMAVKIIILSKNPARVIAELKIELHHPRTRKSLEFESIVDNIYKILTSGKLEEKIEEEVNEVIRENKNIEKPVLIPKAPIGVMSGLLELIDDNEGKMDIYQLGRDLMMEIDDLLPNIEGICMLNFAEIKEGDIIITKLGKEFVEADIDESKTIFKNRIKSISTFRVIENVLNSKKNKTMKEEFFEELFMQHFSTYEVEKTMDSIIDWGRYAELFNYDHDSEELFIDTNDKVIN
jgi:NitT/TauT family transport system ATP-binding protein